MANSLDISVFANPTIDTIIKDGKKFNKIGGPPSYINSVLKKSGLKYTIISKVGKDFPAKEISFSPIVTKKPSTKFILEYFNGSRTLYSPEACEPIKPEDVKMNSKVSLVSGVFCEVLPETLPEIKKKSSIVVADIQGFIRRKDENKKVFNVNLEETDYNDVINNVDFLKASEDEIKFIDVEELRKVLTIVVTRGIEGCTIVSKNKEINIKTEPMEEVDPTGAGDCFLAGFGIGLAKGFDIEKACRTGNYFGGLAVKAVGVPEINREDFKTLKL